MAVWLWMFYCLLTFWSKTFCETSSWNVWREAFGIRPSEEWLRQTIKRHLWMLRARFLEPGSYGTRHGGFHLEPQWAIVDKQWPLPPKTEKTFILSIASNKPGHWRRQSSGRIQKFCTFIFVVVFFASELLWAVSTWGYYILRLAVFVLFSSFFCNPRMHGVWFGRKRMVLQTRGKVLFCFKLFVCHCQCSLQNRFSPASQQLSLA